ncbi:MAG: DUF2807 domain-containing protein [Anaeromyxobacteraceae bacterium]|nr:DUF2807 domain-containing protein [Anaeromyxobacteraceae bacterium]
MRHLAAAVFALALAAGPLSASAHWGGGTSGDGKKVTQQRQSAGFKAIRLEGSLDVQVKVGAPTAVSVTIDENLQPLVETRVDGDTLVIATTGSMSYRGEGRVAVATPSLRGFTIEGSGDVAIDGGAGDLDLEVDGSGDLSWRGAAATLRVEIEGSGDVRLAGTAERAVLAVAGSGDIQAKELVAGGAKVSVAGSGDVSVTLDGGSLEASVAGSGDVHWYGKAQVERASVAGSGEIAHR